MVTFPGTFEERRGIFYCCHAERQLATWLIEECVFRVVGTRTITLENIAQVKEKLDTLPMELRETEIGKLLVHSCPFFSLTWCNVRARSLSMHVLHRCKHFSN